MSTIWIITKRELNSFFDSLLAYVLLVLFLGFSGFFTWISGNDIFLVNEASLQSFFAISFWSLFLFIPALTMRLVAEERSSGTIELILTKPVSDWQFIMGKFLAALSLIVISLCLTIPYYITVASIGPIDHGATITGYLGLIFMSSAYISIGIFASSISKNQIVSFLVALLIGIFFHLLFGLLSQNFHGPLGNVLNYMSITTHFGSISRGVIDSKDIIFFLSIIFAGLAGAELMLSKRNIVK